MHFVKALALLTLFNINASRRASHSLPSAPRLPPMAVFGLDAGHAPPPSCFITSRLLLEITFGRAPKILVKHFNQSLNPIP